MERGCCYDCSIYKTWTYFKCILVAVSLIAILVLGIGGYLWYKDAIAVEEVPEPNFKNFELEFRNRMDKVCLMIYLCFVYYDFLF